MATNAAYVTAAFVLQKIISYFFFLFIAHRLGELATGEYVAAFAYSTLFAFFIDLGLSQVLIREGARYPHLASQLLTTSLRAKAVLAVVTWLVLLGSVSILGSFGIPHPRLPLVAVAGLVAIFDSFALSGYSYFRARQELSYEAIALVLQKIGVLLAGVATLLVMPTPLALGIAILVGGFIGYGWLSVALLRHVDTAAYVRDLESARLLKASFLPFAIAGFFSTAYAQLDSVLLSALVGNAAVGLYSVAAKTMNAFGFIPAAFVAALYPTLSAVFLSNKSLFVSITQVAIRYLLLVSLPIATGLFVLADAFVLRLGPGYAPAATAVRILLPSLPFMFLTFPFGALLNAANQARKQTTILGLGLGFNLAMNMYLIPAFGFIGASVAWSIANVVMFILSIVYSRKMISLPWGSLSLSLARLCTAAAIMGFSVWLLGLYGAPLSMQISIGVLVYGAVVLLSREVSMGEIRRVSGYLRRPVVEA